MQKSFLARRKRDVPAPEMSQNAEEPHNHVEPPHGGTSSETGGQEQLFQKNLVSTPKDLEKNPGNPQLFVAEAPKNPIFSAHDPQKQGGPVKKMGDLAPSAEKNGGHAEGFLKKVEVLGGQTEKNGPHGEEKRAVFSPQSASAADVPHQAGNGTDMWEQAWALHVRRVKAEAKLAAGYQFSPQAWKVYEAQIMEPLHRLQDQMPAHLVWELNNYLEPWRGGPGFAAAQKVWFGLAGGNAAGTSVPILLAILEKFNSKGVADIWRSVQRLAYASDLKVRAAAVALNCLVQELMAHGKPEPDALARIDAGLAPGFEREIPCT